MSGQVIAQYAAATLLASNVLAAGVLIYLKKPLYQPTRWWIGHANNLISAALWVALLALGGFWS